MAAKTFLRLVAGKYKAIFGVQTSSGVSNAGDIPALGDDGYLDPSLFPAGAGPDVKNAVCSENLNANDFVNLYDNAGTINVRKADASSANKYDCDGYVVDSVSSGNAVNVFFEKKITGMSSLTIGADYYISETPGQITATPPTADGALVQYVGKAVSATEINFEPDRAVENAS